MEKRVFFSVIVTDEIKVIFLTVNSVIERISRDYYREAAMVTRHHHVCLVISVIPVSISFLYINLFF